MKVFKNFVTGMDNNTLKEAMRIGNVVGIGLCLLDDLFFENKSDGMVYTEAQKEVEKYLNIKSDVLRSTHHNVNSNIRAFNEVLNAVDDTIDEGKVFTKRRYINNGI